MDGVKEERVALEEDTDKGEYEDESKAGAQGMEQVQAGEKEKEQPERAKPEEVLPTPGTELQGAHTPVPL